MLGRTDKAGRKAEREGWRERSWIQLMIEFADKALDSNPSTTHKITKRARKVLRHI